MNAVKELEEAYNYYKNDPEFNRELTELLNDYAGRPSRLGRRHRGTTSFAALSNIRATACMFGYSGLSRRV